jgi:hypothetical protein
MALTQLQSDILRCLAKNRSETSYLAGGLMLNKSWQRRSDDIDIFHDTDEEVTGAAKADLAVLEAAGYKTSIDFIIYGCVDATISDGKSETIIQWFAETKRRFFPLVKDEEWGARLHQADLAVNKVLAASGRSKARDIADLVSIARNYCPPGPLVLAAAEGGRAALPSHVLGRLDVLSRHRSLRPDPGNIEQRLFLFLDCGLRGPTHGLLGIKPEVIGFRHLTPHSPTGSTLKVGIFAATACVCATSAVCIRSLIRI